MNTRIAIRDAMLPPAESTDAQLRTLGVEAIEIQFDQSLKPLNVKSVDNLPIAAILLMTDFAEDHIDWVTGAIAFAERVGAAVVRVDPLTARNDLSADQIADNCIRGIGEILRKTSGSSVQIGLENHAHFANAESFLDRVLAAIPDPRFGLTLDTGNFYWFGYPLDDIYRLIDKYAPRTVYSHIKSINFPADVRNLKREIGFKYKQHCCGLAAGDLDLRRIVDIFRSHQYPGDFCIENESLFKLDDAQRMPALLSDVATLRNAQR